MLGHLNHVALAVPDVRAAAKAYASRLGARVSAPMALPDHGVTVIFVDLGNSKVELMEPLGERSPILPFLDRNPRGGMHHICYEVSDLRMARDRLVETGARVLGDGEPRIGAHGRPVLFVHPADMFGTLVELEEAS